MMTHSDTMWDLFERMRTGQVRTKENQLLDDRLRLAAITLNSDWGLFDATVMKATVPNLSREEFEAIARATGQGPDRVFAHLSRVFDNPSHDVYHQMATAWHQSVPHLFEDIADLVRPMSKSYGALRVAAAINLYYVILLYVFGFHSHLIHCSFPSLSCFYKVISCGIVFTLIKGIINILTRVI